MPSYTQAEIVEDMNRFALMFEALMDPSNLGLLFVLRGSELLHTKPLTAYQLNRIARFPHQVTVEKHLSEMGAVGLVEKVTYPDEYGSTQVGHCLSPTWRAYMIESGLDETLINILQQK